MNNSIKLILLTNAFPWGNWEPFLETELKYYPQTFDTTIFALSVRKEQSETLRDIPDHVKAVPITFKSKFKYLINSIKCLINKDFYSDIFSAFKRKKLSFRYLFRLVLIISRSTIEAKEIIGFLRSRGVQRTDSFIVYAYRMEYQAYLAILLKRYFPNIRIILRGHRYDLYETKEHPIPLRPFSLVMSDKIMSVSSHGLNYLKGIYPEILNKISVSRLGTLDYGVCPASDDKTLRILSCSTLTPVKRIDRIIEALEPITDYEVIWEHYGEGPLREEIQEKASKLPENISVIFHGNIPHDEMMNRWRLSKFDLFINASDSEGVPVSIMEAMSFGIPVIATAAGGTGEIVKTGINGWLINHPFASRDITSAIYDYLKFSTKKILELRKNVRCFWRENCSADSKYSEFISELKDLGAK